MAGTVLSKERLYNVEYLFENLFHHDDEDTFAFVLVHNHRRYHVYVYSDPSYTVVSAVTGGVYDDDTTDLIDTFVGDFLVFVKT